MEVWHTMVNTLRVLRGTHNLWLTREADGHILEQGEIGYVTDKNQIVIGDGVHGYSQLTKFADSSFIDLIASNFDSEGNIILDGGNA